MIFQRIIFSLNTIRQFFRKIGLSISNPSLKANSITKSVDRHEITDSLSEIVTLGLSC